MPAPTVIVRAEILDQGGQPVAGANVVAALDRTDVYNGVIVAGRDSARTDENGIARLTLFPNDIGSTGSAYDIAAYDAAGRVIYQTRAIFPPAAEPISLHAYATDRITRPTGITEQQIRDVRAARAGIDSVRAEVAGNTEQATQAAESAAESSQRAGRDAQSAQSAAEKTAADRQATAADRQSAARSASTASTAAEQSSADAASVRTAAQTVASDRQAAESAADRADTAAAELEQLITENNALRSVVAYHHGRPLMLNGERY